MRRGFAVLAWLTATAVSVGVSTAAVGSVRDQVSERSSLVSLAAIRAATSTTTTSTTDPRPSIEIVAAPTTTTAPSTTTTAQPADTTTTTTTTPPATSPPARAPASAPPSGDAPDLDHSSDPVQELSVDGGFVKVGLANDSLQLIDALPADGYDVEMGEWLDSIIVVRFVAGDHHWEVVATLKDEGIVLSERRRSGGDAPTRDTPDDGRRGGQDGEDRHREGGWWDDDGGRHRDGHDPDGRQGDGWHGDRDRHPRDESRWGHDEDPTQDSE